MTPKITVITPTYNQGQYIEQTIRSVLDQGYPNLEYIIIDGGSSDNTTDIIKKYEGRLSYWISERDSGQSEAINKALKVATGDIVAWLNSDDWYETNTLSLVADYWTTNNGFDVLQGEAVFHFDGESSRNFTTDYGEGATVGRLLKYWSYDGHANPPQPSVFIRKEIFDKLGPLDQHYHYAMDYDLWLRIALAGFRFSYIPQVLSYYRFHLSSKSGLAADFKHFHAEWHAIFMKYITRLPKLKRIKFYWDYAGFYIGYSKWRWPLRLARLLFGGPIRKSKY